MDAPPGVLVTVLVTGSRHYHDREQIRRALTFDHTGAWWACQLDGRAPRYQLVQGACPMRTVRGTSEPGSADWLATNAARRLGWTIARRPGGDRDGWPADWDTHGKRAGMIRNQEMVDWVLTQDGVKLCIGFPTRSSVGTYDCMERARAAGIPTWDWSALTGTLRAL